MRLGSEAAFQRIDQAVERYIGQRDFRSLVEASQSDGLVGIAGIRCHLRPEPLQWTKAPRLPVRGEFNGDEVQDMGPGDLVDQSMTLANRHGGPGEVDLAGADIKQRVSMVQRDVGLILGLPVRANRLEDQQSSVFLKANPGGAIPLLGEVALDMTSPAPRGPSIINNHIAKRAPSRHDNTPSPPEMAG
jgi:hypothetical protein